MTLELLIPAIGYALAFATIGLAGILGLIEII